MVKIVASRAAGMRLTAIVCVLLIPILLLSHLTLNGLRRDIALTESEATGVLLANLIMPTAIGLADGSLSPVQAADHLSQGDLLAADLGLATAFGELKGKVALLNTGVGEKLNHLSRFTGIVGTESSLLLDPVAETFFLAQTNVQNLPELLLAFHGMHEALTDSITSNGIDSTELKGIIYRLGTLAQSIERTRNSVTRAQASSDNVATYDSAVELVTQIGNDVSVTFDVIANSRAGAEWMSLTMLTQQTLNPAAKYKLERAMWEQTTHRLSRLLNERATDLRQKLYLLMGLAALCVLLGAGSAFWMFRSTLKRLDHVEMAAEQAEAARMESETMNIRISAVNDEVTALNRDLADKMLRLKEAQDELVKRGRMEQLGQLTATVAHEIRNPLGAVRTSAFLLERKVRGKGLGIESQIERINKGVTRCDNIITQLLDFSRTKQLTCRAENLDNWLAETVEEEAARLPEMVAVSCTLGLDDLNVPFDPARMRRAVANLMTNASEAMVGAGDDPARIVTVGPRIDLSSHRDGEHVVICVADNGPGISADNLAKIREPLFTTKSFGTGLGVPAVEKILEQHGGFLTITSTVGHGSKFNIHLPLVAADGMIVEAA